MDENNKAKLEALLSKGIVAETSLMSQPSINQIITNGSNDAVSNLLDIFERLNTAFNEANNYHDYSRKLGVFFENYLADAEVALIRLFNLESGAFWLKKGILPVGSKVKWSKRGKGELIGYRTINNVLYALVSRGEKRRTIIASCISHDQ